MSNHDGFNRSDRVAQKLHEILARLVLTELRDPRVSGLEITDVEVTPDLRHSKVFFVLIDEDDPRSDREEAKEGLNNAKGYLKREVADRLDTKYVPELHFHFDETLEEARRIEEILEDVDKGEERDED